MCAAAAASGDRHRPRTASPISSLPVPGGGFLPIDPAARQQQPQQLAGSQVAPLGRRRLPDIPREGGGDGGSVTEAAAAVVLRRRLGDGRRPAVRPASGAGTADLGAAATGILYAAANGRDSWHSGQLPLGE